MQLPRVHYLGGCVHAIENPKLEPDGFDKRFVTVNGVLPVLPSLEDSGGSNSRYCRNLFSSLPENKTGIISVNGRKTKIYRIKNN